MGGPPPDRPGPLRPVHGRRVRLGLEGRRGRRHGRPRRSANLYPLPASELTANPNLVQNPGVPQSGSCPSHLYRGSAAKAEPRCHILLLRSEPDVPPPSRRRSRGCAHRAGPGVSGAAKARSLDRVRCTWIAMASCAGGRPQRGHALRRNYVLPTASDYRAAGYLHADRKRMIDEDMAQFARMGWDGLRLTFWGDWEASDSAGNLIANDHLDLLDYLIARARERGIYMLFSPIQLYRLELARRARRHHRAGLRPALRQGALGTDSGRHRRAGELPAPDPGAREPVHRRGAQGRAGDPLHRAGQRAGASSGGPRGLGPLHQRAHRRGAPHRVHASSSSTT